MFLLPTFNLTANIFNYANRPPGTPDYDSPCNLAPGRRIILTGAVALVQKITTDFGALMVCSHLLLPAGTDIRGMNTSSGHQWVEVPAGSGTYWAVGWVFDSGKGFDNEHRVAEIFQCTPYPDPLP